MILPSIYMTTYFFNEVKEENLHKVLILIYIPKVEKKHNENKLFPPWLVGLS